MLPSEIPTNFNWGEGLTESQNIELEIRQKKRIMSFWQTKINQAKYHKKQNQKKIKILEAKLTRILEAESK